MSFLGDVFGGGGGDGGYGAMANQIQTGINTMRGDYAQGRDQFQPYQSAGTTALPQYQSSIDSLANPVNAYNNIMGQYTTSPQYLFQMEQMQKAMNQAAAAGGTLGSPSQQQALAGYAQGLSTQDMQRFYGNTLGLQDRYQSGLSNLINTGMNASNAVNNNYMSQGMNTANLYNNLGQADAMGQQAQDASSGGFLSGVAGAFMGAPSLISGAKNSISSLGNLFSGGGGGSTGGYSNGGIGSPQSIASMFAFA